jgi:hypothetical protein
MGVVGATCVPDHKWLLALPALDLAGFGVELVLTGFGAGDRKCQCASAQRDYRCTSGSETPSGLGDERGRRLGLELQRPICLWTMTAWATCMKATPMWFSMILKAPVDDSVWIQAW